MDESISAGRLERNEQLLRNKNTSVKDSIKRYFHNDKKLKAAPAEFICECSDLNCKQRIKISINRYETIHKRKDRFIIVKGHETSSLEKIVAEEDDFNVVEKFRLNP